MDNKLTYKEFYREVMNNGEELFGNKVKFSLWLSSKCIPLGDKPINLITSYDGLELVNNVIERIKHGVYS